MTVARGLVIVGWLALSAAGCLGAGPAAAQSIAAVVNGDPITTIEVDEQMKFLRLIKQPATREAALEDLIADRLKLRYANKFGVDATDSGITQALSQIATRGKTTTQALLTDFAKDKLNTDLIRSHLRAVAAWNEYVKSRNKSLAVSENDVTAALASNADIGRGLEEYQLQEVVVVVPAGAAAGVVEQKLREAQSLRGRFSDCASGLPLARALPDVAVKPPISKSKGSLPENTLKALQQTGKGHLTPPERVPAGISMIAVCGLDESVDNSSIRDSVQQKLLVDRLAQEADKLYRNIRATAVVEKR